MCARSHIPLAWALFGLALGLGFLGMDILMLMVGGLAQYVRNRVQDEKPSIDDLISFHTVYRRFALTYYIVFLVLGFFFMGKLDKYPNLVLLLIILFPLAVAWIRHDWLLYRKLSGAGYSNEE